jgi:hypothetical protein
LAKRAQATQQKAEKQKAPVDLEAQAQRQQKRSMKIIAGIADLELWLQDLMRRGWADVQTQPYSFWDGMAARLIDAQAPGLARRVRRLASIANSGASDWAGQLLTAVSQIYLLIQGYQRQDSLAIGMMAEVRAQVGWTTSQEELLNLWHQGMALSHQDEWLTIGKSVSTETMSNLQVHRTWLHGQQSDRLALILNFAPAHQSLDVSWLPGSLVPAELVFFPSSWPLRAIVHHRQEPLPTPVDLAGGDRTIAAAVRRYQQALTHNPWLEVWPLTLASVTPRYQDGQWFIQDRQGDLLPLVMANDLRGWQLLAASGGQPIGLSGEWDGRWLRPLGIWRAGGFWSANAGEVWT